ncbi:Fibronectin type III domain-containing protein 3B [Chamberlinius hualienensis]
MFESEVSAPSESTTTANSKCGNNTVESDDCENNKENVLPVLSAENGSLENGGVENGTVENGTVENGTVENGTVENGSELNGSTTECDGCPDDQDAVNGFSTTNGGSSNGGSTWKPQPHATPFIPHFLNAVKGPNGSTGSLQSPKRPARRFSPGRGGVSSNNLPHPPTLLSPTESVSSSPNGPQHVVLLLVNPGEAISIQMGADVQLIQGPATVRMVSNSTNPPIPMPVQVPPGHMVQQIVDENGTLRQVILSAQPPLPVSMGRPTFGPGPGPAPPPNAPPSPTTYYSFHQPPPPPPYSPHNQYHPRHPLGLSPAHLPPHIHQHQGPPPQHSVPHNHTHPCNNHPHQGASPPPLHSVSIEERTPKHLLLHKMKRRPDNRQRDACHLTNSRYSPPCSPKKEVSSSKKYKDRNTSTSGLEGGDDNNLQEEEAGLVELLSSMAVPQVSQITSNSALIKWQPPKLWLESLEGDKCGDYDIKESEFTYELLLSDSGRNGKFQVMCTQPSKEWELRSLKPATDYYVCVQAILDHLKGHPSECTFLRTENSIPNVPCSPKLVNRSKSSITVRWSAVVDNGSKVTAYILEYDEGKEGENYKEIFNGLHMQYKITKLVASTVYRFRLAAANEIGRSDFSVPVQFATTGGPPSQPLPPRLVEASVDSLSLAWQTLPNGDSCILQMEDMSTGHGFLNSYNGSESSYICTNLKRHQEYRLRLCIKSDVCGPWSETVSFSTKPARPSAPSRPSAKGRVHSHSFKAAWDPPKDNGGAEIISYNLELDSGNGFKNVYKGSDLEFNCDRLNPGCNYQIRVSCESAGGQSEYSEVSSVVTAAVVPGQCSPPRLHGKPKAISLHVKWSPPVDEGGSAITEYEVDVTNFDGSYRVVYRGRDTDCLVAGLMPGRTYLFRVCAFNKVGRGLWSEYLEAVSSAGPPEYPESLDVICRSPHSVIASWNEPANNGAPITEYRLEWSQKDGEFSLLFSGSSSSYEVTKGLLPATSYLFRVQAVNVAGAGQFCEPVQIVTPSSSPSAISSSSIRASCTPTTIGLSWQAPDCHGSDITSYNIDLGEKHGQVTVEGDVCERLIEGLQPETTYRIRIQAVNGVGVGPFSSMIKVVTKALPPASPRLECVGVSHNSLRLKWGEGKNLDFTRYTLEMGTRNGAFNQVYHGTALSYKVPKLSETTDYHFRIFGSNDVGDGPYSTVHVFTTSRAPPPPLKAPVVSKISETSCFVEWAPVKPMGDDKIMYQLQFLGQREQEYRVIYRGEETSYHLTGLDPRTEYSVRVGGVREIQSNGRDGSGSSSGGSNYLVGPLGPTNTFVTSGPTLSVTNSDGKATALTTLRVTPREPLTDQQWAVVILLGFVVLGFLVAAFIQQAIAYGKTDV